MVSPHQSWTVGPELAEQSLAAAARALCQLSWGRARAWIDAGKFRVDGAPCRDPGRRLRLGETVELQLNAPRPRPLLDPIKERIVHLDEHLVVIDKPPGVSTVPYDEERDTLDVLVARAVAVRRRAGRGRGAPAALGVVHRLDRETSGLMVFALSWLAKQHLAEQFRAHTVERSYLALAHGHLDTRTIRSYLLRDRGDGLRGSRESGHAARSVGQAKLAVTHVELVEELSGASLVRCRLETGRTHQIRIHLGELGHPLLGERAYVRDFDGSLLPAPRLMLHAAVLGLRHPRTGAPMRWELPLPADMQEVLDRLRHKAARLT